MARKSARAAPTVVITPDTPVAQALGEACTALYQTVGVRCVSRQLVVCFCPVCMTEDTRAEIIATPNADLRPALIQEYSNSAHGTVNNTDDLWVLLPRYAELLSRDISVDYNESDEILWRFGAALKTGEMPDDVQQAYFAWGDLHLWHAAYVDAQDLDSILGPYSAVKLLLSGGWPAERLVDQLQRLCRDAQIGAETTASLAAQVYHTRRNTAAAPQFDFIWDYGIADGAREAVLEWFSGPQFDAALDRAMGCDIPYELFMACKIARDWIALNR